MTRHVHAVPAARPHPAAVAVAPDVMATCLVTHAAYVAAVAAVDDQVRRRGAQAGA